MRLWAILGYLYGTLAAFGYIANKVSKDLSRIFSVTLRPIPLNFEPLSNWTTVPFISSLRNGMNILDKKENSKIFKVAKCSS